jgi:hypothetical protein
LAGGQGWGTRESGFNIQSTVGIGIPTGDLRKLGEPLTWNIAFQGHLLEKLWPELEVSYSYYNRGPNDGKSQVALTCGLILGRYEAGERVKLIVGAGYQEVVTSFQTFAHTWLLTGRAAF